MDNYDRGLLFYDRTYKCLMMGSKARPDIGSKAPNLSPIVEVRTPVSQSENVGQDLGGSERSAPFMEHGRNVATSTRATDKNREASKKAAGTLESQDVSKAAAYMRTSYEHLGY